MVWRIENFHWNAQIITWSAAFPPQYSNVFCAENSYAAFFSTSPMNEASIVLLFCIWETWNLESEEEAEPSFLSRIFLTFVSVLLILINAAFPGSPNHSQVLSLPPEPMLFNLFANKGDKICLRQVGISFC